MHIFSLSKYIENHHFSFNLLRVWPALFCFGIFAVLITFVHLCLRLIIYELLSAWCKSQQVYYIHMQR